MQLQPIEIILLLVIVSYSKVKDVLAKNSRAQIQLKPLVRSLKERFDLGGTVKC